MPNDDPQSTTDGQQQQTAEAQQQQNPAQDAQNGGQNGSGGQDGTPTPREVHERAQQPQGASEAQTVADLPDWAQRELNRGRDDAGRYRSERDAVKAEADERIQAILKTLGVESGENEDPEQAAAQAREQAEADAREARATAAQAETELAVFKTALDKGADATALLDSRSFLDRVKDLDPTDTDALAAAIGKAVEDNPRLAATQAAARSSADFTGGDGDGAITQEKFDGMDMAERNALYASDPDTYRRLAAHSK